MIPPNLPIDALAILQRTISEDYEKFFIERQRLIENSINASAQATGRERLRRLQAEIDKVRATSGNPISAAKTILGMLEDYVLALESCAERIRSEDNS